MVRLCNLKNSIIALALHLSYVPSSGFLNASFCIYNASSARPAFSATRNLENYALGLLDMLHIRVVNHEHEDEHQTGEGNTSREHASVSVPVS